MREEMGSEEAVGNGRSGGSSKRTKRSSSSDNKSRQPQRGLGVAQLEKIRLHTQLAAAGYFPPLQSNCNLKDGSMGMETPFPQPTSSFDPSSSAFGLPPNFMMGVGAVNGRDIMFYDPHPSCPSSGINITSSNMNCTSRSFEHQTIPTMITLPLLRQRQSEDWVHKRRRYEWSESIGSSSRSVDSKEELDLDLKLSL